MKKAIMLAVVVFAVSVALAGGFQAAQWGMTSEEVKKAMPDKKWKSYIGRQIYYKEEMFSKEAGFAFLFDKSNKLEKVYVSFTCMFQLKGCDFSEIFLQLKKALTEKYGVPSSCVYRIGSTFVNECVAEDGFFKTGNVSTYLFVDASHGLIDYGEIWIKEDTVITLTARKKPNPICGAPSPKCPTAWDIPLTYEPVKSETPATPQRSDQDKL